MIDGVQPRLLREPACAYRLRTGRAARVAGALLTAVICLCGGDGQAATRYDPAYRFRTIRTAHFSISFHQGEEPAARRLAAIAEDTWQRLSRALARTPPPLTHVVLVDQTERANGFAFPLPYDTVQITATWPPGSDFIGNTDDWLRLVFTHEFTHIVHLDQSDGWARWARNIFGRTTLAFPNVLLPGWQLEGLAAFEESAITGDGRLHAGDFQAIVAEAARAGHLEPIDRVNGGLTDWPGGDATYAYGLGFDRYLADRFGVSKLAELANSTGAALPYLGSRAYRQVFGEDLGALWRDYEASEVRMPRPHTRSAAPSPTRVTHHGFEVAGPRFVAPACEGCPPSVVYALSTPSGFPTLNMVDVSGSASRRLAWRYLGSTTAVGRSTFYFDQQELARNTGLYADLYAYDRMTARVTRLTRGSRLADPDLSPDGRTLACVRESGGRRDLVAVDLAALRASSRGTVASQGQWLKVIASAPDTSFNAPRWSPDGATIAVERHALGRLSEVVVLDATSGQVHTTVSAPDTRVVTPAWRPDGRALLVAAAGRDQPFNLFEAGLESTAERPVLHQMTFTTGGAQWPDVSPDGATIVFVGYTTDGFDLFTLPYLAAPGAGAPSASADPAEAPASNAVTVPASTPRASAYSPWRTLAPTSWSPVLTGDRQQLRIGVAVAGSDLLGYHSYAASATALATSPAGAPRPDGNLPDWQVAYAYDRWRPTLWGAVSRDTSFYSGPATAAGNPSAATLVEQEIQAGVLLPVRQLRWSVQTLAAVTRAVDDYAFPDRAVSVNRTGTRLGASFSNAHTYGYSISPEAGVTLGATTETVRRAWGSDEDAWTTTVDVRAYLPGFGPHHVAALRAGVGGSTGDAIAARAFHLGGAQPNVDPLSFDRGALSLLRGFPSDTFAGSHVAVANADYRWPLARPQRGAGTWPLFLHSLHAAVFADAGTAWSDHAPARFLESAAGAELSARIVAGFSLPFDATIGVARGHDASGRVGDGTVFFVRIGRAF